MTIHEAELLPGKECPNCNKNIVTWWSEESSNPEEDVEDDRCWISTDRIETAAFVADLPGNIIVIEHNAPSLNE